MNPCACGCGVPVAQRYKRGHGRRRPLLERFLSKVDADEASGCWNWTGAVRPGGYGVIGVAGGGVDAAHRVSYELFVGPIPDGLHIDHLCRNRRCVYPPHLEPVTQRENNVRASKVRVANKTRCIRGHAFSPENTFMQARGGRQCRTCHTLRSRARRRGIKLDDLIALITGDRP